MKVIQTGIVVLVSVNVQCHNSSVIMSYCVKVT